MAPYYYYPGWWEGGPELDVFVNTKAYESLSAENKAIVEAAAGMAHIDMQAKYDAKNPTALKRLIANGVKLHSFSNDIMRAAQDAAYAMYDEEAAKNPAFKKIYDDYSAYRRDANLWFRFSEAAFDDFMQQQRL